MNRAITGMATAISASGGNYELAKESLGLGLRISARTPELLDTLVGAGLDIASVGGTSAEEGLALALKTGKMARVADPVLQARNIDRAIAGAAANRGANADPKRAAEESAELFAAINLAAKDPTGESSRTAVQQVSTQMKDFFTKGVEVNIPGLGTRRMKVAGEDPGTDVARFQALQQNEALRKQFLAKAHFEAGYGSIVEKMLTPGTTESKYLDEAQRAIDFDTNAVRDLQSILKTGSPQLQKADVQGRAKAAEALRDIEHTSEGIKAEQRRIVSEALEATRRSAGSNWLDDWVQLKNFDIGQELEYRGWMKPNSRLFSHEMNLLELRKGHILGGRPESALTGQQKRDFDFLTEQQSKLGELFRQQTSQSPATAPQRPAANPALNSPPAQPRGAASADRDSTGVLREIRDELKRQTAKMDQPSPVRVPSAGPAMNGQRGLHTER